MINTKNKRTLHFNNQVYYWNVKYDKDRVRPYIYIISEDKKTDIKQSFDKEMIIDSAYIKNVITHDEEKRCDKV